MHGSISHLIAISLFGLSHRTKFLLNTITKQQNKSCFAQVLAKAVEETPLQKERITQITFGSISASTRGRGFQEQNYRLGKTLKSSQQHKWNLENRKAHAESSVWRASVGGLSGRSSQNKCRTTTVVVHREDSITIPPLFCFACHWTLLSRKKKESVILSDF